MFWIHDNGLKRNEHVGFINDYDVTDLYTKLVNAKNSLLLRYTHFTILTIQQVLPSMIKCV